MAGQAEVAFDQVDELARWLFNLSDPGGVWAAQDHPVQENFRREAARKLQEAATRERA